MLCYVILYYATLRYVTLRYIILYYIILYYITWLYIYIIVYIWLYDILIYIYIYILLKDEICRCKFLKKKIDEFVLDYNLLPYSVSSVLRCSVYSPVFSPLTPHFTVAGRALEVNIIIMIFTALVVFFCFLGVLEAMPDGQSLIGM